MEATRKDKDGFELETCGRCGGSGQHSYNQINGTTCFGCGGTGLRRSKRGKAAYARYQQSLLRPVSEVTVGNFVKVGGKWIKVEEVKPYPYPSKSLQADGTWKEYEMVEFTGKRGGLICATVTILPSVQSEAHRKALVAAALAA